MVAASVLELGNAIHHVLPDLLAPSLRLFLG